MAFGDIMSVIQSASVILAILVAFGTIRSRQKGETENMTEMRVDIKYIKEKVSDIEQLRQRLAIVENSAERAHARIDDIKKKI